MSQGPFSWENWLSVPSLLGRTYLNGNQAFSKPCYLEPRGWIFLKPDKTGNRYRWKCTYLLICLYRVALNIGDDKRGVKLGLIFVKLNVKAKLFIKTTSILFPIDCSLSMQSVLPNTVRKSSRKTSNRHSQRCSFCRHEKPPRFYVSWRSVGGSGETFRFLAGGWKPQN